MARWVWKELTKLEVRQPLWARALGAASLNSRAMRRIVSAGMSVMGAAHSGVYGRTSSANFSKPTVYCSTKLWSYRSSKVSTLSIGQMESQVARWTYRQPIRRFSGQFW